MTSGEKPAPASSPSPRLARRFLSSTTKPTSAWPSMCEVLQTSGFTVVEAEDGAVALGCSGTTATAWSSSTSGCPASTA